MKVIKRYYQPAALFTVFVWAVIYRLVLIRINPQMFAWDQVEYDLFARTILQNGFGYVFHARLYGLPLLIAGVYTVTGASVSAWYAVQAVTEGMTTLLVYAITRRLFPRSALPAAALYAVNPYTSAYTGVMLSEIFAAFVMTLGYVLLLYATPGRKFMYAASGFVFGYLCQIKPALGLTAAGCALIFSFSGSDQFSKKIIRLAVFSGLFFVPFLYNLAGNIRMFGQAEILTVDNLTVREFYNSVMVERQRKPVLKDMSIYPPEVMAMYHEYSSLPKTPEERRAMAGKYLTLAKEKINSDPVKFWTWRVKKLLYVWEKYFLFPYDEPVSVVRDTLVFWGNRLLLLSAIAGMVGLTIQTRISRAAGLSGLFIIGSISLVHAATIAEGRYSIPVYPVICVFAAIGINMTIRMIRGLSSRHDTATISA